MLTLTTTVKRSGDLLATEIDGDLVMLSLRTNKYYGMKVVGRRIWELLGQPITPDALITTLMAEFEVERERCETDTMVFLNQLNHEKLLDILE